VDIPSSINGVPVTSIGASAFQNCSGLTSITIPSSVTNIGAYAFDSCTNLTGITVDESNPVYSSLDGVLFNKDKTVLIQCPGGKTGAYTIPDSVTNIGSAAFSSCIRLTSVTIGSGVISIGNGIFYNCVSLTSVTIPGSVASIGIRAFDSCTNLEGVYFLGHAPSLGSNVFYGDNKATVYYLPETGIWEATFGGRPAVLLPYTYTTTDGAISITGYTGSGGAVTIPDSINGLPVTGIADWAFSDCTNLTSITIPASNISIGNWAFAGCINLTGVYFLGNAPSLGLNVFSGDDYATVYRVSEATDWPVVPATWGTRPTALWQPDSDTDGIPDAWEKQYFGSSTGANPDTVCSNGVNTLRHAYIAGLNPNDPQSAFLTSILPGRILQWNAVSGRVYSVYWTTNLLSGFQCLESNIPWTRGSFTNPTTVPCGYYKIDVRMEE
jgi:hypothetical protein